MKPIDFFKLQASGNDFILISTLGEKRKKPAKFYQDLARKFCPRKLGVGADGILLIEPSKKVFFRMRIFNADGSEAEMCGNGARCSALWASQYLGKRIKKLDFATQAGIIESKVSSVKPKDKSALVKIKVSDPHAIKLDMPLKVLGHKVYVSYLNTGVPHVVIPVEGLDNIDVDKIGSQIRYHKKFAPQGTNVNFIEVAKKNFIKIRTYERGVGETLACGTGSIASAIIYSLKNENSCPNKSFQREVSVKTKSSEVLKISFTLGRRISDVWLCGNAYFVFKGTLT